MDGANHYRFADDADSLAGWESASNVIGPPRSGGQPVGRSSGQSTSPATPPQGGEIEPAA